MVLGETETLLSEAGYRVLATTSFAEGKQWLDSRNPMLLVAAVRLGPFNGLHLAMRARIANPDLPIVILNDGPDVVLEREAKSLGVRYFAEPTDTAGLLQQIDAALGGKGQSVRRWPRKQVRGAVATSVAFSRARVLDLSYGGLRLAFERHSDVPTVFDVTFPAAGITVKANRVWTSPAPASEEFWCGAELSQREISAADWRHFVDSVH